MPIFKVSFSGYSLVKADSEKEAEENFHDDFMIEEMSVDEIEELEDEE